jgi:hypothetical protein
MNITPPMKFMGKKERWEKREKRPNRDLDKALSGIFVPYLLQPSSSGNI